MGSGTLPYRERLLLKDPWSLRMGLSSGSGSSPPGFGVLPWRVALLGLGVLGVGVVSPLLGLLGGLPLLPVMEPDGPAICVLPATS